MRIAALDVGSNSFHLMVADVETGGRINVLDRAKEMVRLGDSTLHKGVIAPEVFRRGLDALKALRRIADRHKVDALVAVATSAVREAQNGGEFVRAARDEAGIDIRVIRGDEEARLIYLGARGSLDLGKRRVALFDLGGGSLEIVLADAQELYYTSSLKLGVIRLTESFPCSDPPTPRERAHLADRVRAVLEPVISRVRAMGFDYVAFTSGTASALAGLLRAENGGNKSAIALADLTALEQKLGNATITARGRMPGLDARRADTIYAGAVVFRTALELAGAEEATLCETALREGIVADYVASNRPGILLVEEFPDLRRRSVMELARRCHFREDHGTHVARLALSLFHQTRRLHKLTDADAELLEYAALLHDIGFYISPHRHHRHTEYLIKSHAMTGFSKSEVQTIALTARHHRKAEPRYGQGGSKSLSKHDVRRVRYLAAILRVADALDRTHGRLVRAVRCSISARTVEIRVDADGDPELELWAARRKGDLFEALAGRKLRFAVDGIRDREEPPVVAAAAPEAAGATPLRVIKRVSG
ncbi:MAG TPA: Ppx/GppA phosphatase family protein [Polyangia bacterium]|nr:Ppx/GppA phosphatase family protein [Polyangia bacterium]